ncbi:MAG: phage tail tip lysozyme [Oscillospiraceae bacterium]|nr:phage tail tip lysozyme [Oscillospiraceae bacterium]
MTFITSKKSIISIILLCLFTLGFTNGMTGTFASAKSDPVERFVTRLYEKALQRLPDAAGLRDWTNRLKTGAESGGQVAYGFVFSREMISRGLSNDRFVETLYEMLLGRASDPGGKADWVGRLNSGTPRENIFAGFVNSVEFDRICKEYGIVRGTYTPPPIPPALGSSVSGGTPAARVWNTIVSVGFRGISDSPEHIAGIIGNLIAESGPHMCPFQQSVGSGTNLGIVQWQGGRRTNMETFMYENGISKEDFQSEMNKHLTKICSDTSIHDDTLYAKALELQVRYMVHELSNTAERTYMNFVAYPFAKTGTAGAKAYAELFCGLYLRTGSGGSNNNDVEDSGVLDALRASIYYGGAGNLNRTSFHVLNARRDRAESVYLELTN